jgi:hypothetical protein
MKITQPRIFPYTKQLPRSPKEALIKSFDKLRMNGNILIPFVVSLSNHERNQFVLHIPKKSVEARGIRSS